MNLIIDTSSSALVAILFDGKQISSAQKIMQKHQEHLLPQIDKLLASCGKTLSDVKNIFVVVGPGSFTGIRLAVATAKAIKYLNRTAKLYPMNKLDLLRTVTPDENRFAILIKCTNTRCYTLLNKRTKDQCVTLQNADLERDIERLKLHGYGFEMEKLGDTTLTQLRLTDENYVDYAKKLIEEKSYVSLDELSPVYMALSQAEEELMRRERERGLWKKLSIRPFSNSDDINELYEIHKEMPEADRMSFTNFSVDFYAPFRTYFVAHEKNDIVGYAGAVQVDEDLNIIGIAVKESAQKNGVGTKLLSKLKWYAKKHNLKSLSLEVDEKNKNAVEFYNKNGFVVTNVRKKYYKDNDAYIMFCYL